MLADSSCDYCKGYIFVLVPGYVVGDFLYLNVKKTIIYAIYHCNILQYLKTILIFAYQIIIKPAATDKRHKIMKTFEINNETITIEEVGYGQYVLSGLSTSVHCTDSEIWDWCDDDENEEKHLEAKESAYRLLVNSL